MLTYRQGCQSPLVGSARFQLVPGVVNCWSLMGKLRVISSKVRFVCTVWNWVSGGVSMNISVSKMQTEPKMSTGSDKKLIALKG